MPKKILIDGLSQESINHAIKEVQQYKQWVMEKENDLRFRLATLGATVASIQFSRAVYSGTKDVSVRVDNTGSVAVIYAEGEAVAFIEFGAGDRYGHGHPQAGQFGVGPGTYPEGKGLWNNPKGWFYGHNLHTYGNPPAMGMARAVETMAEQLTTIAREVFRS